MQYMDKTAHGFSLFDGPISLEIRFIRPGIVLNIHINLTNGEIE